MGDKLAKIKEDGGQLMGKAADRVADAGTGIAQFAKEKAAQAQKLIKDTGYEMRMRRYNPLFPADYFADGFRLPQMIVLSDGEERKDIDVCKGAIGWTSQEAKLTVVHLYRNFVEESGITFCPSPVVDAVYMVDTINENRYIDLGQYFYISESEKVAELVEVGRSLGAKKVTVKSYETAMQVSLAKAKMKAGAKAKSKPVDAKGASADVDSSDQDTVDASFSVTANMSANKSSSRETRVCTTHEYPGSAEPHHPKLYWYRDDLAINNLVDSLCGENANNRPKRVQQEVSKKASESVAGVAASQVDAALKKMDADINFSFEGEVKRELRQTLALEIEF